MVLSLSKMGDSGGRWSFLAGLCGVGKAEGGLRGGAECCVLITATRAKTLNCCVLITANCGNDPASRRDAPVPCWGAAARKVFATARRIDAIHCEG